MKKVWTYEQESIVQLRRRPSRAILVANHRRQAVVATVVESSSANREHRVVDEFDWLNQLSSTNHTISYMYQ